MCTGQDMVIIWLIVAFDLLLISNGLVMPDPFPEFPGKGEGPSILK